MNQSSYHVVGKVHGKLPPPFNRKIAHYPNPNPYPYPNLEENLFGPILRGGGGEQFSGHGRQLLSLVTFDPVKIKSKIIFFPP